VGKTMLARSLAQHLYGDPDALVNASPGAPEGTPVSGAGEARTGRVLLFDDVDAHGPHGPHGPDDLPGLLNRHDDDKSVLVLSSGASTLGSWSPPGGPAMKAALLARIDQVVHFRPLEWPQRRLLVQRMLEGTRADALSRGVRLEVDGAALDWLAGAGFDPAAGARPLRRLLQQEVQSPLERLFQAGETPPGSRVLIGAGGPGVAGLRIEVERPSPSGPGQER
jgi:C-terminal, D2-small domain, of ClpB protein